MSKQGRNQTGTSLISNEAIQTLGASVSRALLEDNYESRKKGAREVESIIRFYQEKELAVSKAKTSAILRLISEEFLENADRNARVGGLMAMAGAAIGLQTSAKYHLDLLIPPVVKCCRNSSQDFQIKYYGSESLFNIIRSCQSDASLYFIQTVEVLQLLWGDTNKSIAKAADCMDSLLRDILVKYASPTQYAELEQLIQRQFAAHQRHSSQRLSSFTSATGPNQTTQIAASTAPTYLVPWISLLINAVRDKKVDFSVHNFAPLLFELYEVVPAGQIGEQLRSLIDQSAAIMLTRHNIDAKETRSHVFRQLCLIVDRKRPSTATRLQILRFMVCVASIDTDSSGFPSSTVAAAVAEALGSMSSSEESTTTKEDLHQPIASNWRLSPKSQLFLASDSASYLALIFSLLSVEHSIDQTENTRWTQALSVLNDITKVAYIQQSSQNDAPGSPGPASQRLTPQLTPETIATTRTDLLATVLGQIDKSSASNSPQDVFLLELSLQWLVQLTKLPTSASQSAEEVPLSNDKACASILTFVSHPNPKIKALAAQILTDFCASPAFGRSFLEVICNELLAAGDEPETITMWLSILSSILVQIPSPIACVENAVVTSVEKHGKGESTSASTIKYSSTPSLTYVGINKLLSLFTVALVSGTVELFLGDHKFGEIRLAAAQSKIWQKYCPGGAAALGGNSIEWSRSLTLSGFGAVGAPAIEFFVFLMELPGFSRSRENMKYRDLAPRLPTCSKAFKLANARCRDDPEFPASDPVSGFTPFGIESEDRKGGAIVPANMCRLIAEWEVAREEYRKCHSTLLSRILIPLICKSNLCLSYDFFDGEANSSGGSCPDAKMPSCQIAVPMPAASPQLGISNHQDTVVAIPLGLMVEGSPSRGGVVVTTASAANMSLSDSVVRQQDTRVSVAQDKHTSSESVDAATSVPTTTTERPQSLSVDRSLDNNSSPNVSPPPPTTSKSVSTHSAHNDKSYFDNNNIDENAPSYFSSEFESAAKHLNGRTSSTSSRLAVLNGGKGPAPSALSTNATNSPGSNGGETSAQKQVTSGRSRF